MKNVTCWLALALSLVACESAAGVGGACTRSSECTASLTCTYGRCRSACRESRDCPLGVRCIESDGAGVCTIETEERCTDAICAAPLRCVDGQCRTECTVTDDCLTGACDRGSCVELVSGSDAGMPDAGTADAGPPDAFTQTDAFVPLDAGPFACDPTTGAEHGALLDAILGADRGPAGFRMLSVGRIAAFTSPQNGASFLDGQITITTIPDASFGQAWFAYAEGPARALHIVRFNLQDPSDLVRFFPEGASTTIDHVLSFALATDEDRIRGIATIDPPPFTADTAAWVFTQGVTEPAFTPIVASSPPRSQFGRATITGGRSPYATLDVPLFFVMRERDETRPADMLSHVDLALGSPSFIDTFGLLPDGFVETDGSHGNIAIAYDPGRTTVVAWDQRAALLDDTFDVVTDATGVPAIATEPGTTIRSVVGYPRGTEIVFRGIDCPAGDTMPCRASLTRMSSMGGTSGQEVRRVDLAPVTSGYAFAALEAEASGGPGVSIPIRHIATDLSTVWDCDSGVPCIADVFPPEELAAGEVIADMRLSATRSVSGVGIVLAVLIRNESMGLDRIWVGGLYACRA